jgi:uncharacterized membrane protein
MVPLIVLVVSTLVARGIGALGVGLLRDWAAATRVGLAVMFCFTAVAHFNEMRPDLVAMVPPAVPYPELVVTITGICEILGAVGLLVPRTRRLAAVALIVFLVAVLPANVHAARAGATLGGSPVTPLIPRVALQLFFIGLLWWSGVRRAAPAAGPPRGPR